MKNSIIFVIFCLSLLIFGCGDGGKSEKTADNGNDSGRENTDTMSDDNNDYSNTDSEQNDDTVDPNDSEDSIPDDGDSLPDNNDSEADNNNTEPDDENPTTQSPCNPNPCQNVQNSTGICTEQGSYSYSCGCKTNYTWNSSSKTCRADSKMSSCTGLPAHASWNTVSSIMQTWNGYSWVPSATGTYSEYASSSECRFKCDTNYKWNGYGCAAATQTATCYGLPTHASWNTVSTITQTWDGYSWVPSEMGTYNEIASTEECRFMCNTGYLYDDENVECANPCEDAPCENVANSTQVCTALSGQDYSCECLEGYSWNGEECIVPLTLGNICTGQEKCYNNSEEMICSASGGSFFGQDAQYKDICTAHDFKVITAYNQKIVIDKNTTLQWQQTIPDATFTWEDALSYCEDLEYAGYSDWRLPSPQEFLTIIDSGIYKPTLDETYFPNMFLSDEVYFWSSQEVTYDTEIAYNFTPSHGSIANALLKTSLRNAVCVRGNKLSEPALVSSKVNNAVVVTDLTSGLMWQKTYSGKTWQNALSYCENSNYAGYSDWRLPNKNELASLLNYESEEAYSDFLDFPYLSWFWSSSTRADMIRFAWFVGGGSVSSQSKDYQYYARCVRNGTTQTAECTGLPDNASWNAVSTITQAWDGSDWQPSKTGVYDENESISECRFKCNPNYTWKGTICEPNSQVVDCDGLPDNAEWNSVFQITQTWDGSDWQPSKTGVYYESESEALCRFQCLPGYEWNGSRCYDPKVDLPDCGRATPTPCKSSGLIWSSKTCQLGGTSACTYCRDLNEGGFTDWYLPSIDDLRTLIRHCSSTMPGGACGVTDSCFTSDCYTEACNGCNYGYYTYSVFGDENILQSSYGVGIGSGDVWGVDFEVGRIVKYGTSGCVRCVRKPTCNFDTCNEVANSTGVCIATGEERHICECKEHYTWNGTSCEADTKEATCSEIPDNATWNSVSEIIQTWNGEEWTPSEITSYNETSSTNACYFKCNSGYVWNDSNCQNPNTICSPTSGTPCSSGGKMWSVKLSTTWELAVSWCENLTYGGFSDWRLPTISELRRLVKNCPDTVSDGLCSVSNGCLASSCENSYCSGCYSGEEYSVFGDTDILWSSSKISDDTIPRPYVIDFSHAKITDDGQYNRSHSFRCVR